MQVVGVDIGNSAIKMGWPGQTAADRPARLAEITNDWAPDFSLPNDWFWSLCSVNDLKKQGLLDWLAKHRPSDQWHVIQSEDVPIETNVDCRDQVGRDRLVAAWQAWKRCENELIVVDAGTAVTIDHVDSSGVFQGGVIFPGATSSFTALGDVAQQLPDVFAEAGTLDTILSQAIGKNTKTAILRGVFHGQIAAIKNMVESIADDIPVFATGGEIEWLRPFLPEEWTFEPRLVIEGASEIGTGYLERDSEQT